MDILPIFSTSYSLSSILTIDVPKNPKNIVIEDDATVSIIDLSLKYQLPKVIILEKFFTNYWQCVKNFNAVNQDYIWAWRVTICQDSSDKSDASELTESDINIFFRNSESYYKIIKWATKAQTTNFHKKPRLDWKELQELYGDGEDFDVFVDYYNGFIARNLLRFNSNAIPSWGNIKPFMFINNQEIAYENLLEAATKKYAEANNLDIIPAHNILYYKNDYAEAWQTYKCILTRATLYDPEMKHCSSDKFSFEAFMAKIGQQI